MLTIYLVNIIQFIKSSPSYQQVLSLGEIAGKSVIQLTQVSRLIRFQTFAAFAVIL